MFFGEKLTTSVNGRWNINDFVDSNRSRGSRSEPTSKDENELSVNLKKIETAFSRGAASMDSVLKDIKAKRKEIRGFFKSLENDPENHSAFQKMDIDLILSQIKVEETKIKMIGDKYKQMRDEKKLLMEKTPKVDAPLVTVQQNNPMSNVTPHVTPGYIRANINPKDIIVAKSAAVDEEIATVEEVSQPSLPLNTPLVPGREDLVTKRDWTGRPVETVNMYSSERQAKVAERLTKGDEVFKSLKTVQGLDYERSIKSLVNKTKDLVYKMYVDNQSGCFYIRSYEKHGDELIESPTECYKSIMHIGIPEFNTRNRTVKTQYEDEPMDYVVVEGTDNMPDYYKQSWADPTTKRFKLPEQVLDTL